MVNEKTDPEVFMTAAKKLGFPSVQCIVAEDSYAMSATKRCSSFFLQYAPAIVFLSPAVTVKIKANAVSQSFHSQC
ncbi:hypothetical protein SAMN05421736_101509 [Evansella caseinilytica]|uniref:Uncharacterized protein n=1 Tax=Evansella caseinilytica TaxID=1503961 RepID=A0A1H3HI80_9BACI|nr:hypothetical protein [Evansella caseinilytica]SDY15246.1 hypothetical protein SAMN05421736_101509 [Evansella caseinilytica]